MLQKNQKVGLLLAMLVAWAVGTVPCGAFLLPNGDMELGGTATVPPTDWADNSYGGSVAGTTNDTPDGSSQSLSLLRPDVGGEAWVIGVAAVEPGDDAVRLLFSYKGDRVYYLMQAQDVGFNNLGILPGADAPPASPGVWTNASSDLIRLPVGTAYVRVWFYDNTTGSTPVFIDNVSMIPEPSSAVLLGMGALGLGVMRRRFRR